MIKKDLKTKIIEFCDDLLKDVEETRNESEAVDLSDIDSAVAQRVANSLCDISVCGEVKKGKSLFINALLSKKNE